MRSILAIGLLIIVTAFLILCIVEVWWYIPIVAFVLVTAGMLSIVAAMFGSVLLLFRMALGPKAHNIGEFGTVFEMMGQKTVVYPNKTQVVEEDVKVIEAPQQKPHPLMDDVVKDMGERFIFGYDERMDPKFGDWRQLNIFFVLGVSQSGKSNTLLFISLQALLLGMDVWICDSNWTKTRSLSAMISPLRGKVKIANSSEDISVTVSDFIDELRRRKNGVVLDFTPTVLVFDEWTEVADEYMVDIETLARQGSGYNMFLVISGQLAQQSRIGSTMLRNSMQAAYVHRIPAQESRKMLPLPKHHTQTEELATGYVLMKEIGGKISKLYIPHGGRSSSVEVKRVLESA